MIFTRDEKTYLLRLARAAVDAGVRGSAPPEPTDAPPSLVRPAGAFVSLHKGEDLRGCVGYVEPRWLLPETVVRAGAAATQDRRFPVLLPAELVDVAVEVSVLGALERIDACDVEVGVHGLVIRGGGRSGLLLPHVPTAYGWDRERFLFHLCRKAGLPDESWRRKDVELLAFTSERFSE
jgi:AmmeMemoRadiSam system protein A